MDLSANGAKRCLNPINLTKGARGKYCDFANFNNGSRLKDRYAEKYQNISNLLRK